MVKLRPGFKPRRRVWRLAKTVAVGGVAALLGTVGPELAGREIVHQSEKKWWAAERERWTHSTEMLEKSKIMNRKASRELSKPDEIEKWKKEYADWLSMINKENRAKSEKLNRAEEWAKFWSRSFKAYKAHRSLLIPLSSTAALAGALLFLSVRRRRRNRSDSPLFSTGQTQKKPGALSRVRRQAAKAMARAGIPARSVHWMLPSNKAKDWKISIDDIDQSGVREVLDELERKTTPARQAELLRELEARINENHLPLVQAKKRYRYFFIRDRAIVFTNRAGR